jgi:hypothetical protein
MIYFKELDLPEPIVSDRLLNKIRLIKRTEKTNTTIITNVGDYLNPCLLDKFSSVGATPLFFVAFGSGNAGATYLHSDITFKNNQWASMPCSINWELTPGDTTWTWWDIKDSLLVYPTDATLPLHGVHCNYQGNKDVKDFELLETYKIKSTQAVMYRTDYMHKIEYNTMSDNRICISIRFSLDDVPTWERSLEIFRPFFIEQH